MFWAIADIYPGVIARRHVQVRLTGNFGLNGGIPWLVEADGSLCFTCREDNETLRHFFFDCPAFKPNFDSLCCNLLLKASNLNATGATQISQFITNLDRFHKTLLLLGCLRLPFDNTTVTSINKSIASAVAKIYKIRTEKLRDRSITVLCVQTMYQTFQLLLQLCIHVAKSTRGKILSPLQACRGGKMQSAVHARMYVYV